MHLKPSGPVRSLKNSERCGAKDIRHNTCVYESPLTEQGAVVVGEDRFKTRETVDEDVMTRGEGQQTRQI